MYNQIHQQCWWFSKLMSVKLMIHLFKKKSKSSIQVWFSFSNKLLSIDLFTKTLPSYAHQHKHPLCYENFLFHRTQALSCYHNIDVKKWCLWDLFSSEKYTLFWTCLILHHLLSSKPWKYSKKHLSDEKSWENLVQIGRQLHMSCIAFASCTLDKCFSSKGQTK